VTTDVPLATGSYVTTDPRASSKKLIGLFSEIGAQTSDADTKEKVPPIYLRRSPGIDPLADNGQNTIVRGFREMKGVLYTVIGSTLYSVASTGVLTELGTGINGTNIATAGFVRMVDNTECLFILIPGTSIAYTYCPDLPTPFAQFLDPTFLQYGAIDVWFVDSFFVFLRTDGRGFYNDDGQPISGLGPPTFTTFGVFPREFGTDLFVGMAVDHRDVVIFGTRTSEVYTNNGSPTGSPFADAPDGFMQIGIHPDCGYTPNLQDQSVFWVAQDCTIRRRNGQTPERVSNSGIEQILQDANLNGQLVGAYSLTPTINGHPLWILTLPAASRTLAYDCLTTEWHELQSLVNNIGYWRPACWYNAFGQQLVGDSQSGRIGTLSTAAFTEFGVPCYASFTTQSVFDGNERIVHGKIELVITPGASPSISTGALVTLFVSDDSGQTWRARETKSLGAMGQRTVRVFWTKLGQSRNRVYKFQISDPTPTFMVSVKAQLSGGKW
jgi:hypothetical protein